MATRIDTPTDLYYELWNQWELPDDLMAGTERLRLKGPLYLPKHPRESDTAYQNRIRQSFLFNVFKRTIRSLRGKVFSNPIILGDDTPDDIVEWSRNIDLQGQDLTTFAQQVFTDALIYGVGYILVTFPRVQTATGQVTRADNIAQKARPYFVHISPKNLIGWHFDYETGMPVLQQARFRQFIQVPTDDYNTETQTKVWVLRPGRVEVFAEAAMEAATYNEFMLTNEYTTTLNDIPLVPVYTQRTGDFQAECPLEDLAYLNIAHWQSASDQKHVLHVARVPILFGAGLTQSGTRYNPETGLTEETLTLEIGPNTSVFDSNENARLAYIYHDRAPIDAGRQDLKDLEDQMEALSLVPLMPQRSGNVVATAKVLAEAQANSALAAWALNLRNSLETAFRYATRWANLDYEVSVTVPTEFGLPYAEFEEIRSLLTMRRIGDLSRPGLYAQLQRYNILPDDFDADEEIARIKAEEAEAEAARSPETASGDNSNNLVDASGLEQTENLAQAEGQEDIAALERGVQRSQRRI